MRSENELIEIALAFVTECNCPQSVFEFAAELEQLGSCGASILAMRANKWKAIIDRLVTDGKLTERDWCVVAIADTSFKQLALF